MPHPLLELASAITAAASVAGGAPAEGMRLKGPAAPPPGYTAFCLREPQECGGDVLSAVKASAARATEAVEPPAATAPTRRWSLSANATARPDTRTDQGARPMTPGRWRQIVEINTRMNQAITPQADKATWGVEDYWALSLSAGDCEDYVLAKRHALLAAGFPTQSLNIAVVTTPAGETHAVLLVAMREGEFVLDNLSPWVRPWTATAYTWLVRQVNGEPFIWAEVG